MSMTMKAGPSYQGRYLEETPGIFGPLESSIDLMSDAEALRERMKAEGYLYMPGLLNTDRVRAARNAMIDRIEEAGVLDPAYPREDVALRPGKKAQGFLTAAIGIPEVHALLYDGEMMAFWQLFLGGEVRHFDYTWFRAGTADVDPTPPHCDTVYMNRGTENLYTAWTPFMDVPYDLGGLMILEQSHTRGDLLSEYWKLDVDTYCTNKEEDQIEKVMSGGWRENVHGGYFDRDAFRLQNNFDQRWLSTEYKAGDILVFGMHTMHAAGDNRTNRIRLSTDSRYQLASEPVDERWVGDNPVGHGPNAKKGMIC